MGKTCLVVKHVDFEGLGLLRDLLQERDYDFRYAHANDGEVNCENFVKSDLVIVLGGPYGAYEGDKHPFIKNEIECVRARLASGKPLLGICLGAQLMAAALGAKVASSGSREIGWRSVTLTPEGRKSCLAPLETQPILHWHGDNCELPDGCTRLAYNDFCSVQAFYVKPHQLGVQFHMEVAPERLDVWVSRSEQSLKMVGLTADDIRAQAKEHGEATRKVGQQIYGAWLDSLEAAR